MYRHGCVSVFCWLCEVALYISQPSITISNTQDLNGEGDLRSVGPVALGLWGSPSRTPPKRALNQPDSKTLLSPNSARLALHLEYMDL